MASMCSCYNLVSLNITGCHGTYGHTEVNPYGDEEEMIFSEK